MLVWADSHGERDLMSENGEDAQEQESQTVCWHRWEMCASRLDLRTLRCKHWWNEDGDLHNICGWCWVEWSEIAELRICRGRSLKCHSFLCMGCRDCANICWKSSTQNRISPEQVQMQRTASMPYLKAVLAVGWQAGGRVEETMCRTGCGCAAWLEEDGEWAWACRLTHAQGFLLACFPQRSQKGLDNALSLLITHIST